MYIRTLQRKKFCDRRLYSRPDYGKYLAEKCSQNHIQCFIIEKNIIVTVIK